VHGIRGFVALARGRDAAGRIAVRRTVYPSAQAAEAWHADGLEAALESALAADLEAWVGAPARQADRVLGFSWGAARRQLALAIAWATPRGQIRDAAAFAEWCDAAQAAIRQCRPEAEALLGRAVDRVERLRTRLKQGARNLAAANAQRHIGGDLARLLAQPWAARLPWTTLRRLDALLDALLRRLDGNGADAARSEERIANLNAECDAALDPADERLRVLLGLAGEVRRLSGQREECALAYATPGSAGAAARSEADLRLRLMAIEKAVDAAQARIASARQRLSEVAPLFGRMPPGARRQRLERELAEMQDRFPDLTLGSDLDLQHTAVEALVGRIRAAI
jgi:hypothetical protein